MDISTASLCTLPEELILRILEFAAEHHYLPKPAFSYTIRDVALTCRLLHRLALPVLYAYLNFEVAHPQRFLLTIVRAPRLGRLVRHVDWHYRHLEHETYLEVPVDQHKELAYGAHKQWLATPFAIQLFSVLEFRFDLDNEFLAALLMFTPNVESITIKDQLGSEDHRTWLDPIRFGTGHAFQHLKVAKVAMGSMDLKQVVPLFLLPSMKELYLTGLAQPKDDTVFRSVPGVEYLAWPLPCGISNIEILSLRDGYIDSRVLKEMLKLPKKLTHFEYEFLSSHIRPGSYQIGDNEFNIALRYANIFEELGRHRETLQHLRISDHDFIPQDNKDRFPSLRRFSKLKTLQISFHRLVSGLQEIDITAFGAIPDQIEDVEFMIELSEYSTEVQRYNHGLEIFKREGKDRFRMLKTIRSWSCDDDWREEITTF